MIHELDGWWLVGVFVATVHLEGVDSVLMDALVEGIGKYLGMYVGSCGMAGPTCGGPRIVPFQLDINRSSPSVRPYEHASRKEILC